MGSVLVTVAMLSSASNVIHVVMDAASAIPNRSGARSEARECGGAEDGEASEAALRRAATAFAVSATEHVGEAACLADAPR